MNELEGGRDSATPSLIDPERSLRADGTGAYLKKARGSSCLLAGAAAPKKVATLLDGSHPKMR